MITDLNKKLIKYGVAHGGDIEIYKANEGDWIGRVHYGENHDGLNYVFLEGKHASDVLATLLEILNDSSIEALD
jgi:hypothetical protein